MKIANLSLSLLAAFAMLTMCGQLSAQECAGGDCGAEYHHGGGYANDGNCTPRPGYPCPPAAPPADCIGATGPHGKRYIGPAAIGLAARDHYSPAPLYAYGSGGLDATRFDYWNRQQSSAYSWHGGYNYWRWGSPTALVVPPTAAFQTEYNWGVAQTRSLPIYHQFSQNAGGGMGMVGGGSGMYGNTPYWPSSTSQFGIYPVRGPW
ncbi:MAG: hypothetical protein ACR2NP_20895 [Pirellulaceae bacterium]